MNINYLTLALGIKKYTTLCSGNKAYIYRTYIFHFISIDHGNSWMKRIIPLDIVDNPRAYAKVLFEGVTGASYRGDIAIDDINFLHDCYYSKY